MPALGRASSRQSCWFLSLATLLVVLSRQPEGSFAAKKEAEEVVMSFTKGDDGPNPAYWSDAIITPKQVLAAMAEGKGPIRFLDATWFNEPEKKPRWKITQWFIKVYQKLAKKVPPPPRNALAEYEAEHIKGALFWDIEKISKRPEWIEATETEPAMQIWQPHDHMVPETMDFIGNATAYGIHYKDAVVIYNQHDCYSAPYLWFIFKVYGHGKVYVLNGGLPAWKEAGGETESGPQPAVEPTPEPYKAYHKKQLVLDENQVMTNAVMAYHNVRMRPNAPWVLDARPKDRFEGKKREPRLDCVPGHIPNSLNLPFTEVLKEGDLTKFKSSAKIREAFQAAGVDLDKQNALEKPSPIIHISGSGIMAAVNFIAACQVGRDDSSMSLYDGGYAEWGQNEDRHKYKGPPGVQEAKIAADLKKRAEEREKHLIEMKAKQDAKEKAEAAKKEKEEGEKKTEEL